MKTKLMLERVGKMAREGKSLDEIKKEFACLNTTAGAARIGYRPTSMPHTN